MGLTLGDIAGRFGCELHGDPDVRVEYVATLDNADGAAISFLANEAYRGQLEATSAAAVICGADDVGACPTAALVSANPYAAYAHVATLLHPPRPLNAGVATRAPLVVLASILGAGDGSRDERDDQDCCPHAHHLRPPGAADASRRP